MVEITVLGSDEKFRHAVMVPIDDGRRRCMPGDVAFVEQTHVLEDDFAVTVAYVSQPVGILAVEQNIEPTVSVPIDDR